MPRRARIAPGEIVYHALNRANGRNELFHKAEDYSAFERIMVAAMSRFPIRLLAYCLMPNHWHMVLWPSKDGEMTAFLRWLTITHSQRLHAHRHTTGYGHIYQGRFKSFPIEQDEALLNVLRYVERNALRANLVERAQEWHWCSLWRRLNGDRESLLSSWPFHTPADWLDSVNVAQTEAELDALRKSVNRGAPYGSEGSKKRIANALRLEYTLRPRGRPRKEIG
ncbi:MAG TPA: transposase [Candidatus Binatia bacterium]|jgi:putative transposase|nr:transposase [Candidatus Binatia bacterium]